MTSIFLELRLQGLNRPRDKREVENSEYTAVPLRTVSCIAHQAVGCAGNFAIMVVVTF